MTKFCMVIGAPLFALGVVGFVVAQATPAEADCAKLKGNWVCGTPAQVQALATRKGRKFKGFRPSKGKEIKTECTPGHYYKRDKQWYLCRKG